MPTRVSRAARTLLPAAAALACAGCGHASPPGSGHASPPGSLRACSSFGVQAIERHLTVTAIPRQCAGLNSAQVNQAVASAIHTAVGPRPKAVARRLAERDGRYLARLVRRVPAAAPVAAGSSAGPAPAGRPLSLSALACWAVTAAMGLYLLGRGRVQVRRRRDRLAHGSGMPPAIAIGHAAVAVTGLATWVAFTVTGLPALAWAAVALVATAAGLGMAALVGFLPEPPVTGSPVTGSPVTGSAVTGSAVTGSPVTGSPVTGSPVGGPPVGGLLPGANRRGDGWSQSLVTTVVAHGLLATATMLLVLLAAINPF
jgi:hypothetical protein